MKISLIGALIIFGTSNFAIAQSAEISPGKYLMDEDAGALVVKKTKIGGIAFKLYAESGAPGYSCSFDGNISNGRARLRDDDAGPACEVTFKATGEYILVTHNGSASCHSYCGSDADFDNLLFKREKPPHP